jgi:hypothetical protein
MIMAKMVSDSTKKQITNRKNQINLKSEIPEKAVRSDMSNTGYKVRGCKVLLLIAKS